MVVQMKHRFSVKEYYRMAETGVLPPDARVELLNGEIIDLSPIGPFHGGVANYLNQFFTNAARHRWIMSVQNPVRLEDHSEPQPDLMLLKPASDFYRKRHPQPEDVFLLI
jgi:Uma2 family endonuclease